MWFTKWRGRRCRCWDESRADSRRPPITLVPPGRDRHHIRFSASRATSNQPASWREERAMTTYMRWSVSASDLTDMTAAKARDLIVQCFQEAQREHLAAASEFI